MPKHYKPGDCIDAVDAEGKPYTLILHDEFHIQIANAVREAAFGEIGAGSGLAREAAERPYRVKEFGPVVRGKHLDRRVVGPTIDRVVRPGDHVDSRAATLADDLNNAHSNALALVDEAAETVAIFKVTTYGNDSEIEFHVTTEDGSTFSDCEFTEALRYAASATAALRQSTSNESGVE